MAAPINVFRTLTIRLTEGEDTVYTAPPNNTAIVLMAQVSNNNPVSPIGAGSPDPNNTSVQLGLDTLAGSRYLVKNFGVPAATSANLLSGKLVVEENQDLRAGIMSGDSPADADGVDLILSVLEARNA